MSAEDSVKWATQQCEAIFKKWADKPDRWRPDRVVHARSGTAGSDTNGLSRHE